MSNTQDYNEAIADLISKIDEAIDAKQDCEIGIDGSFLNLYDAFNVLGKIIDYEPVGFNIAHIEDSKIAFYII